MIEEVKTGRFLAIQISPISSADLRSLRGWRFQWKSEAKSFEVFKLVATVDPRTILGLISIVRYPGFVEVRLLESSPANVGKRKKFKGIAGSLLAYAAKVSFDLGYDGVLMLVSKTVLVRHYSKTYGFRTYQGSQKLILVPDAAIRLIVAFGVEAS